ncbi:MAG: phosphatidylserine decarboxylase, partial [Phycisphaerae bacterium]|nr:phosphatidylserine decarboxylase [Phycisphaerae bacterium]
MLTTLVAAAACVALVLLGRSVSWLFYVAAMAPVLFWLYVVAFFRDPDRATPTGPGLFVSPADGCVTDVTPLGPDSPLGRDGVQIGIFMNLFDVHVNRSPADARVERIVHRKGIFLDARDPQAAERNESATIYMTCVADGAEFPVIVRQIAGLIARRIVTDISAGQ